MVWSPSEDQPKDSADVFLYANDTLTIMADANALVKFGGKYREEIEAMNFAEVINSVIMEGELYGVPFTMPATDGGRPELLWPISRSAVRPAPETVQNWNLYIPRSL